MSAIWALLATSFLSAEPGASTALRQAKTFRQEGKAAAARQILKDLVGSPGLGGHERAEANLELSQVDLAGGHYPEAIHESGIAFDLYRSLNLQAGAGSALTIRGLAKLYAGKYPESLEDFYPALAIARKTGDLAAQVTRLNNLGTVFYFQGDYGGALRLYEQARGIVDAHADETWNLSRKQLTVANIATVYQRLGQYDRALASYTALREGGISLPPEERAQLLANVGALYRRLGDPVKALATYREAQAIYRTRSARNSEIAILNNIGIAQALDLGEYKEALRTFDDAVAMARKSGDVPVETQSLLYRAETLYRMQQPGPSQSAFENAYQTASKIHAAEEQWKALFGLARNDAAAGAHESAMMRLRDAATQIEAIRGANPLSLRGGFLADKRQVYDLLLSETLNDPGKPASEIFRLIEQTRSRSLQDTKGANRKSLEETRKALPDGTLVLDYWLGENSMAVVWFNSRTAGTKVVTGQAELRLRIRKFAESMADGGNPAWEAEARELGAMMLPNQAADPQVKRLIVIPDRELSAVPFEVLPVPDSPGLSLVNLAPIAYSRAAAALPGAARPRLYLPFWKRTLMAFANPARGAQIDPLNLASKLFSGPLAGAEGEVREVAELLGGRTNVYAGEEAKKSNLARPADGFPPVLHFATHALTDTEDPGRSYLLLAGANGLSAFDYLFLKEVAGLDLRGVDLVTLSACETAKGKLVEGEGVASFSGAFLDAGARTVVGSLWPVGDRSTSELMRGFYGYLKAGEPVSHALRDAKLKVIQAGHTHPYYWAGFVIDGENETILPYIISGPIVGALGLMVLGLGFFAINAMRRRGRLLVVRSVGASRNRKLS